MYTIVHTIFCMPNKYVLRADLQSSCKIVYNSCFSFRYYIENKAEALLLSGKAGIKWIRIKKSRFRKPRQERMRR